MDRLRSSAKNVPKVTAKALNVAKDYSFKVTNLAIPFSLIAHPGKAAAMNMSSMIEYATLYEWEHPMSPAARMLWISVIPITLFLGNMARYLYKTDVGFCEIQTMIE